MNCHACNYDFGQTHKPKFCPECGYPVLSYSKEDGEAARAMLLAWDPDSSTLQRPFDEWREDLRRDALLLLAKAREVLGVEAKDAEIARLKAELAEEKENHARRCLDAQELTKQLEGARNELAVVRQDFARASTAAANARRDAYHAVVSEMKHRRAEARVAIDHDAERVLSDVIDYAEKRRDASQPAAETQTCSDPGCGQCACQSSREHPLVRDVEHDENCDVLQLGPDLGPSTKPCNCGADKSYTKRRCGCLPGPCPHDPRPLDAVIDQFDSGFPGQLPDVVRTWLKRHGLRVLIDDPVWALNNLALDIASARPSRDVEGLARAIQERSRVLDYARSLDLAKLAIAHLDGGP